MITVEEKLNTFSKLIFEKVQNESGKKLEEMYVSNEDIIAKHKEDLKKRGQEIINKKIKAAHRKKNQIISKASMDAKKSILAKKKELMERLISDIKVRAIEFTETKEYIKYLLKDISTVISSFKDGDIITLYLIERDMKNIKDEITGLIYNGEYGNRKVDLFIMEESNVGGVKAVNKDKTLRIDATLNTKIEENKALIGQILYKELEGAGDSDE